MRHLAALVALLVLGMAAPARADQIDDYAIDNRDWNGMSELASLAGGMGLEVVPVAALQWSDLTANDVLLLVYPMQEVDPVKLAAFINAGGYAIVADDFGQARDALTRLGVVRSDQAATATTYWANRAYAPIALPTGDHPITEGVDGIVTNHPAVFTATDGVQVIAGFKNGAFAVVGSHGMGRFVALSDPSVLINRMLRFPGNGRFVTNLLRWLDRGGRVNRLVIARGDVTMFGDPRAYIDDARGGAVGRNVGSLNQWLGQFGDWLLTPIASRLVAAGLLIALIALLLAALPLKRGAPADGRWLGLARTPRRDDPALLIAQADGGTANYLLLACMIRDRVQDAISTLLERPEALFTVPPDELARDLQRLRGEDAARALLRTHRRLRALPSRSQAAAPWNQTQMTRRDYDALEGDLRPLCTRLDLEL